MKFILGKKIGMTRIYDQSGRAQAVTVVKAGPCQIAQIKTAEQDGYAAIQLSYGRRRKTKKPLLGHLKSASINSSEYLREFKLPDDESVKEFKLGQTLDVTSFESGDQVSVQAVGKGKGFTGVVKRHHFSGGPETHGSNFHRRPGSIGGRWPQRVAKGRKLPGHMGDQLTTIKNLEVLRIDPTNDLLAIKGAIPGPRFSLVKISNLK